MEGFSIEPICDVHTEDIRLNSIASRVSNPEIRVHPSGCVLPRRYEENISQIYNFEVFPDDTWIITFPKSGTTWTQEMVWLLRNNFDYETAKATYLMDRCPFLEIQAIMSNDNNDISEMFKSIEKATKLKRPRCIKSHLPVQLLPKALWTVKPKIIYVTRDPRDVAVSYYHHYRLWNGYKGTLENFTEGFLADRQIYSPFWSHVLGFLTLEDKSHVLLNTFEEMKQDLTGVIRKTAKFMEISVKDEEIEQLRDHLTFESMKNNVKVNYSELANEVKKNTNTVDDELLFFRKGESGNWVDVFSTEMKRRFDEWISKNLDGTPFKGIY